jgi:mono/diheme cytochrome c family protein
MMKRYAILAALIAGTAAPALALTIQLPRETASLKPGAGLEIVQANCALCHSLDYIATQPPGMGKAFWQGEVTKMIGTYGAPVDEAATGAIVEYLSANY